MISEYRITPCIYCSMKLIRRAQNGDWDTSKNTKLSTVNKKELSRARLFYDQKVYDYYICDNCRRISMCDRGTFVP